MEPVSIALISAAVFGTVVVLAAFVRQMMLSRDKQLNDEAQNRALTKEVNELEKMRNQMQINKRFDSHYQVIGANKDAILYLDSKIEGVLRKKTELIERYAKATIKESGSIVSGEVSVDRKIACDKLREEIDKEMAFYDNELKTLQDRRSKLWDTHTNFQKYLLAQEKLRNLNLDNLYSQHSALLEKVYLRHIDDTEIVAIKSVDAATMSFKDMVMVPIQFLMQYFGVAPAPAISLVHTNIQNAARIEVEQLEKDINQPKPAPKKNKGSQGTTHQHKESKDKADDSPKSMEKEEKSIPVAKTYSIDFA